MTDLPEVQPPYPDTNLEQKTLGKNIMHAPQSVTAPPGSPSWATGSETHGTYLTSSNTTELTAMYTTLNDIYNALLKEGLIKKKT